MLRVTTLSSHENVHLPAHIYAIYQCLTAIYLSPLPRRDETESFWTQWGQDNVYLSW